MPEAEDQCVQPAKGPIMPEDKAPESGGEGKPKGGMRSMVKVGKPAPDFEASAFVGGGFKNVKLSDYKGKWVVLCFYPGDFTFV
jgi:hypothetical protein